MPQTVNAAPLRWSKSKDSLLRVTRQAGIKKKGGGWVFFTPQVCAARRSQLWAKMYLWHKNGVKRDCAQTDKCVHNLYGQHCCDSSRICDLQQMCHLFPPTNSLLFSALMVRAHYLFHRARQASSGDRAVPEWPQQPCHQRQHTCQSEMLHHGNSSHRQYGMCDCSG